MKTLLTKQILENNKVSLKKNPVNKAASVLASVFSVLFSLSILKEASNFIQEVYILVILFVFVVLFLVYNEYLKVRELRSKFLGQRSFSFIIVLTFVVSFCMSGVGIYFWTNKTLENTVHNDQSIINQKLEIENEFTRITDSVRQTPITSDENYIRLNSDIDYWHGRSAANLKERNYIRGKIDTLQREITAYTYAFNKKIDQHIKEIENLKQIELQNVDIQYKNTKKFIKKGNNISFIFFIMVIITELIIILLAREHAFEYSRIQGILTGNIQLEYIERYKILSELLSRKNEVKYDDVAHSPFNTKGDDKKHTKSIFYCLGDLGIAAKIPTQPIQITKEDAINKLNEYYETILNL